MQHNVLKEGMSKNHVFSHETACPKHPPPQNTENPPQTPFLHIQITCSQITEQDTENPQCQYFPKIVLGSVEICVFTESKRECKHFISRSKCRNVRFYLDEMRN